ncbi:hypothetical protein [Amycolatopsis circi]|uniref:hypothetical protein n=1 Tax=Amycolatopsis circi TaxID=871959 RepID=UPI000E22F2E8|nr:hypothetical protein [Amycolatopsis circi]
MPQTIGGGWKPSPFPRREAEPEPERRWRAGAKALASRFRPRSVPPALVVSAIAWSAVAFLTIWAGSDAFGGDPDQRAAQEVSDQFDSGSVVGSAPAHPQDFLALLVGGCLVVAIVLALVKKRWALPVLSVLAVAAVIVLALGGHGEAAIVFFAFVVGAVTLLAESVQQYLS